MTDNTLFENNQNEQPQTPPVETPQAQTPPASQKPDYADLLSGIVNDQGEQKFKTVEDLIKGYTSSQDFISTLKAEKQTAESELAVAKKLEELLQPQAAPEVPAPQAEQAAGLSPEDVVSILKQEQARETMRGNLAKVKGALSEAFGNDFEAELGKKIGELGITPQIADQMAMETPDALLKILSLDKKAPTPDVPHAQGGVNTTNFTNTPPAVPKQSVMRMASSKDMANAWAENREKVAQQLKDQGYIG